MKVLKLQSLQWFEENAYQDESGDFWVNEEEYLLPPNTKRGGWKVILLSTLLQSVIHVDEDKIEIYKWGAIEIYNHIDNPEYFI